MKFIMNCSIITSNEIVQNQENIQITEGCLVRPSYYGLWTLTNRNACAITYSPSKPNTGQETKVSFQNVVDP